MFELCIFISDERLFVFFELLSGPGSPLFPHSTAATPAHPSPTPESDPKPPRFPSIYPFLAPTSSSPSFLTPMGVGRVHGTQFITASAACRRDTAGTNRECHPNVLARRMIWLMGVPGEGSKHGDDVEGNDVPYFFFSGIKCYYEKACRGKWRGIRWE
jgi:hypothetical protein